MRGAHRPRGRARVRGLAAGRPALVRRRHAARRDARSACREAARLARGRRAAGRMARRASADFELRDARQLASAAAMSRPRLLLVTDAVGGVWVYSLELARALRPLGVETVLAVMGPSPDANAARGRPAASAGRHRPAARLARHERGGDRARRALRLPSLRRREGVGRRPDAAAPRCSPSATSTAPIVAVQHSCVATWWRAVKGRRCRHEFGWRTSSVERGLDARRRGRRAEPAFAARDYARIYGVPAASRCTTAAAPHAHATIPQGDFVFTAGRLWDEGKNIATLDRGGGAHGSAVPGGRADDGPNGARIALIAHARHSGELTRNALGAAAMRRARSMLRPRSTSRSACRCSRPRRPAARWCCRISRRIARSGTARRSSCRPRRCGVRRCDPRPARRSATSASSLASSPARARQRYTPRAHGARHGRDLRACCGRCIRRRRDGGRGMRIVYFTHSLRLVLEPRQRAFPARRAAAS